MQNIDHINPLTGKPVSAQAADPLDDPEPSPRLESSDQWVIWDIETGPQALDILESRMPEFTAAANLKDPEKIKADIESKKAKYITQAALSPLTGKVVAVGVLHSHNGMTLFHGEDEKQVLQGACGYLSSMILNRVYCIGFNIHGFDLPFLRFRAMVHGVPTPHWTSYTGRAYWFEKFRDLLPELVMGRDFSGYNLDAVCKAMGLPGKTGDGAHFYELYKTDPKKALDYLAGDLKAEAALAKRMGIIE